MLTCWTNSLTTYLLTYSMVQSPSWEANWFAASQEIPRTLWNPKVHYCTHKRPPPVPILGQPNPVHIPTSHLLKIHPNIIHPSIPSLPSGLFPSDFPTKTLYTPSLHPYAPHAQPISFFSILNLYVLPTYSMVQSPSWEANWFAASQEIPRILWNPKVHYRTHKRLPPVPILGQPNPVHIPTSHLLGIHPNIIHPSTLRSSGILSTNVLPTIYLAMPSKYING